MRTTTSKSNGNLKTDLQWANRTGFHPFTIFCCVAVPYRTNPPVSQFHHLCAKPSVTQSHVEQLHVSQFHHLCANPSVSQFRHLCTNPSVSRSHVVPIRLSWDTVGLGHGRIGTRWNKDTGVRLLSACLPVCLSACQPACIMVFRV